MWHPWRSLLSGMTRKTKECQSCRAKRAWACVTADISKDRVNIVLPMRPSFTLALHSK